MKLTILTTALAVLGLPAMAQDLRDFTAANGTFQIPADPQRIVSLNDQILTLPLIEMGATVIGSAGRIDAEGNHYLRGGMDTLGVDFANSDIAFVGTFNQIDIEAIAALEPDLILGGLYTDAAVAEQLQAVAPTLIIDNNALGLIETLRSLSDAAGANDAFEARYARYQDNLARTRDYIGTPGDVSVTLTFTFPAGDELWVYRDGGLGAISQVIADLGFAQAPAVAAMAETQTTWSRELIEDLDADYIFGFYRQQPDATPAAVHAAYERFAPGWCAALTACTEGRFILLPGPSFGSSMTSLDLALELVEAHVATGAAPGAD